LSSDEPNEQKNKRRYQARQKNGALPRLPQNNVALASFLSGIDLRTFLWGLMNLHHPGVLACLPVSAGTPPCTVRFPDV
jgi:hypothetical protein